MLGHSTKIESEKWFNDFRVPLYNIMVIIKRIYQLLSSLKSSENMVFWCLKSLENPTDVIKYFALEEKYGEDL